MAYASFALSGERTPLHEASRKPERRQPANSLADNYRQVHPLVYRAVDVVGSGRIKWADLYRAPIHLQIADTGSTLLARTSVKK
jgi:hypothetical protein